MRNGKQNWRLPAMLLGLWLAGCGGGATKEGAPPAEAEAVPAAGDIKRRLASSLPKVGEYLPPQDGGRIEIAPPAGWKTLPRGTLIAGFYQEKANKLPRITVDAQPANLTGLTSATPENADELAQRMATILSRQSKAVQEPPKPIMLGDTIFARHVRLAKHAGSPAVIQSLQTVRDGRLYTVELFCEVNASRAEEYESSLTAWRDHGYAVAANLRFIAEEASSEPAADTLPESPANGVEPEKASPSP